MSSNTSNKQTSKQCFGVRDWLVLFFCFSVFPNGEFGQLSFYLNLMWFPNWLNVLLIFSRLLLNIGCWKLRSNPQPCVKPRVTAHWRPSSYHYRRPGYWFVTIIYHLPLHKGPYGKSQNISSLKYWVTYTTWPHNWKQNIPFVRNRCFVSASSRIRWACSFKCSVAK